MAIISENFNYASVNYSVIIATNFSILKYYMVIYKDKEL